MRWQTRGTCRDHDPELFFPPDEGQGLANTDVVQHQVAVAEVSGCRAHNIDTTT